VSENGKQLKPGWQWVKFGDVVQLSKERCKDPIAEGYERFIGLEHLEPGDLKIRRWGDTADGITFTSVFKPGQVLFGKRRAYQRKAAVADFSGVCSGDIYVFESKNSENLLPELLPFICQTESFFNHAVGTSAGSLSPRTNWTSLASYELALPPIDEQIKISEFLLTFRNCKNELESSLDELIRLKMAFAKHAFSKGLKSADCNDIDIHFRKIPSNWSVKPLGEVFELLDNKRVPLKDSERNKRPGPYPYYGASGPIDSIDDFIFDEPLLLLAEDGMNLLFRNSPIVYKVVEKCWVNNHAHVLRPTDISDIDFFQEYLESINYEPYVTGTYQKKITKSDCERIPLPVPPMDEQLEIASIFRDMNNQISDLKERLQNTTNCFSLFRENTLGIAN
jgi:restriction endonuclease S subunit